MITIMMTTDNDPTIGPISFNVLSGDEDFTAAVPVAIMLYYCTSELMMLTCTLWNGYIPLTNSIITLNAFHYISTPSQVVAIITADGDRITYISLTAWNAVGIGECQVRTFS